MDSVISRFDEYMKLRHLTDKQVNEDCNLSNGILGKARSGRNDLGKKTIERILDTYTEINRVWLLTGAGHMLLTGQTIQDDKGVEKKTCAYLPLLSLDSVGGLHSYNAENGEEYTERYVPVPDARPKDVLIPQSGTSMSPAIPPGALLQIRQVEEWKEYIGYGNVFVLVLKDGRRITKEIRRYEADPKNYFWCVSYNPDVADEELPKHLVSEVYQVIRVMIDKGW